VYVTRGSPFSYDLQDFLQPSRMRTFPPELMDRVIDSIGDDQIAVKNCGLVCRQWYPRSRFHFFSEVKLQVDRGLVPDNIESFMGLVSTSSFDILAAITRLTVRDGKKDSPTKLHLLRFGPCSRLTDLSLAMAYIPHSESASIHTSLHTQLAVVGPNFSSSTFSFRFLWWTLRGLLDILACLPTVENLLLHGSHKKTTETSNPIPLFLPQLRSLNIKATAAHHFFEHMLSLSTVPFLRALKLNQHMGSETNVPIDVYLQRTGHALESLSIALRDTLGEPLTSYLSRLISDNACLRSRLRRTTSHPILHRPAAPVHYFIRRSSSATYSPHRLRCVFKRSRPDYRRHHQEHGCRCD
jgi:hypothetical protein